MILDDFLRSFSSSAGINSEGKRNRTNNHFWLLYTVRSKHPMNVAGLNIKRVWITRELLISQTVSQVFVKLQWREMFQLTFSPLSKKKLHHHARKSHFYVHTLRQVQAMLIARSHHHRAGERDACQCHDSRLQHNLFRTYVLFFSPSNVSLQQRQGPRATCKMSYISKPGLNTFNKSHH